MNFGMKHIEEGGEICVEFLEEITDIGIIKKE